MAVVVIVAILGTLATIGVRKYILASKSAEATGMIAAIKIAQEAYKAETFMYRDISGGSVACAGTSCPGFYPATTVLGRKKMGWGGGTDAIANGWRELGVSTNSGVMYIYGCAAGAGNVAPAAPGITIGNYPSAALGQPWYVIKAAGDLDGDGEIGTWVGVSFDAQIYSEQGEE